jgi:hypothetical protein
LKLWGSPKDRGYAHGYLLGQDIVAVIESALLAPEVINDPSAYEQTILSALLPKMKFEGDFLQELEGMLAGIEAAVGADGMKLARLQRRLELKDLQAINALADWSQFFCSSFSAWGEFESNGEMITARNLDFFRLPGVAEKHVVIVYLEPGAARKRWVSVAWPALIGAYTAMNEEGVTISIHDVRAPMAAAVGPFVPRTLALREAIERASADSAVSDVQAVLEKRLVLCGNNIHVSGPFRGQQIPAAIFEYDGNTSAEGGVTMRTAVNGRNPRMSRSVYCTNHYRLRQEPARCDRFEKIEARLTEIAASTQRVDISTARSILREVAVRNTLQSVVFLPNRRELMLGLATPTKNAAEVDAVALSLEDLLKKN